MLPCSEKYPSGPVGLDLFRSELWQWIEDLCRRNNEEQPLQCPDTMDTDPYQDNLAFLYFAMSDLDKMKLMQKMGVVLQKEKTIQKSIEAFPERKYEFQEERLTVMAEKREVIQILKDYEKQS